MNKDEALRLALLALVNGKRIRNAEGGTLYQPDLEDQAIAAIKQALEQPEPEPVPESTLMALARRCLWIAYVWNAHNFEAAYKYAREEAQAHGIKSFDDANTWLTSQPKREPLTEESLENLFLGNDSNDWWRLELKEFVNVARAIERAHDIGGEK